VCVLFECRAQTGSDCNTLRGCPAGFSLRSLSLFSLRTLRFVLNASTILIPSETVETAQAKGPVELATGSAPLHGAPMRMREVLDRSTTPDQAPIELAREAGHYVIRVAGKVLMSSAAYGSEQRMAATARELLGPRRSPQVLVGGLGMGFTLRAVLDGFGRDARVTVAELLPAVVGYVRTVLAPLAGNPLSDPRVELYEGDVRGALARGGWDAILLDVDNGPDALTTPSNASLYSRSGSARLRRALAPDGVLVVWSAAPDARFEARLRAAGLDCRTERVRARAPLAKAGTHTLFIARPHRSRSGRRE
jgi:spermidine synthase